jgi:hypothetical protein
MHQLTTHPAGGLLCRPAPQEPRVLPAQRDRRLPGKRPSKALTAPSAHSTQNPAHSNLLVPKLPRHEAAGLALAPQQRPAGPLLLSRCVIRTLGKPQAGSSRATRRGHGGRSCSRYPRQCWQHPKPRLSRAGCVSTSSSWGGHLQAGAAPDDQGEREGEHDAGSGPADLDDGGLALRGTRTAGEATATRQAAASRRCCPIGLAQMLSSAWGASEGQKTRPHLGDHRNLARGLGSGGQGQRQGRSASSHGSQGGLRGEWTSRREHQHQIAARTAHGR